MKIFERVLLIHGVNHATLVKKLLANNIKVIWLKKISDTELLVSVSVQAFSKVKQILQRNGYVFHVNRYFPNWGGLFVGIVFSLLLLIISNQFCLQIKINSTQPEITASVQKVLSEECKFATLWGSIDYTKLTEQIYEKCPDVGLVSFSRRGNTLVVDFVPKTPPVEIKNSNFQGIFASADGVVGRIFVESGTQLVNVGDTVHIGQMLIAPYQIIEEEMIEVEAKGRIFLDVWQSATVEFSENQKAYARTGKSVVHSTIYWKNQKLVGHSAPLWKVFETEERVGYLSDILPLKAVYTTYYELGPVEYELKFEDEKDSLELEAREKVLTIVDESDIMEEKVTFNFVDGVYYVTYYVKIEVEV